MLRLWPPVVPLNNGHKQFLSAIYPDIDWEKVVFHKGIPWHSPYPLVLPGTYDNNKVHVYVSDVNSYERRHIATLVHEAYHVQQYYDMGPQGFGFYRRFIIAYLGNWFKYGYQNHPMEIPAFRTEALLDTHYHLYSRQHQSIKTDQTLARLSHQMLHAGEAYFPITKSDPVEDLNWFYKSAAVMLSAAIVIAKPFTEMVLFIPYFIVKSLSSIKK